MYEKIFFSKEEVNSLIKQDIKMELLIKTVGKIDREYISDPFVALLNSIVYQQIAFKAALAIWTRFEKHVKNITPENVLNCEYNELRECGLSKTKISYINNISEAVLNKTLDIDNLYKLSDESIIEELVKIKGIGVWTAEMFLIFSLNRRNTISYLDLGIRKGIKWLYNLKEEPTKKEFEKYKKKFGNNSTLASFYLWEITIQNYFKYNNIEELIVNNNILYYESPIGLIEIKADNEGLLSLGFVEKMLHKENLNDILLKTKIQLEEYFHGRRKEFDIPLNLNGTEFQKNVWTELINCKYGITSSYKDIAIRIKNPKAVRAIGNANNKNKIAIIIPCHRVVGSNGKLVGYAGGLWRKKWLLELEYKYK